MVVLLLACVATEQPVDLLPLVRPTVGTGGLGFGYGGLSPAATAPNGLVKVGPDTSNSGLNLGFDHSAGFHYDDPHVEGFSHHRLPGIGVGDGGALGFLPKASLDQGRAERDPTREVVRAGYYFIDLPDRATVELTATPRVALHRYDWHAGDGWLMIDLAHTGTSDAEVRDMALHVDGTSLTGFVHYGGGLTGRGHGLKLYFAAELSDEPDQTTPHETGVNLHFNGPLQVKVALSTVSVDGARTNLAVELPGWGIAPTLGRTQDAWEDAFDSVVVTGGSPEVQEQFATALYHARMMPTVYSDVDGRYVGMDLELHEDGPFYSDYSMWDTYRTLHPWVILAWPSLADELAYSLTSMGDQLGYLPRWPAGQVESGSMIGDNATIVLSESYRKGVTDWPVEDALALSLAQATDPSHPGPRNDLQDYLDYGYIPADLAGGSVAKTLEHGVDDAALGGWLDAMGQDGSEFHERALGYRHVYNPESGFVQGRNSDGTWVALDQDVWPEVYVEGNHWQYTWLIPHDLAFAADLAGRDAWLDRLEECFVNSREAWDPDNFAPAPYYWHGNEPDLHYAYVFAALGRPSLTQEWVPWVRETHYAMTPDGLDGNDDGGTLSAWYLFTAIGLYPLNGTDRYVINTPLFDRVELPRLTITASGEGDYIASATLNGEALDAAVVTHAQLMDATLHIERSPQATDWGAW